MVAHWAPRWSNANNSIAARISAPNPAPWALRLSQEPELTVRVTAKFLARTSWIPMKRPSQRIANTSFQSSGETAPLVDYQCRNAFGTSSAGAASVHGKPKGIVAGS